MGRMHAPRRSCDTRTQARAARTQRHQSGRGKVSAVRPTSRSSPALIGYLVISPQADQ